MVRSAKQRHPNNFPACPAIELGTAGKAGGYVTNNKAVFLGRHLRPVSQVVFSGFRYAWYGDGTSCLYVTVQGRCGNGGSGLLRVEPVPAAVPGETLLIGKEKGIVGPEQFAAGHFL